MSMLMELNTAKLLGILYFRNAIKNNYNESLDHDRGIKY